MTAATILAAAPAAAHTPLEPAYLSASTLLAQFRDGRQSPVDVLEAQIARIRKAYDDLSRTYQSSKTGNDIPLN